MNMTMRTISCLLLLLFLLCSCGNAEIGIQHNGRELTESEIEALLKKETETSEMREGLIAFREGEKAPTAESVFWTESGSVFHFDSLCHHLSKAKDIYYGTAEDAVTLGKERACTACENQE